MLSNVAELNSFSRTALLTSGSVNEFPNCDMTHINDSKLSVESYFSVKLFVFLDSFTKCSLYISLSQFLILAYTLMGVKF